MNCHETTEHESSGDTGDPRGLVRAQERRQEAEEKDDLSDGKYPILPLASFEVGHNVTLAENPGTE